MKAVLSEKVSNACRELGEIELFGTQANVEHVFSLGLVARFDALTLCDTEWAWRVTVRLSQALIQLRCQGARISRDGRAGDEPRPRETKTKHTTRKDRKDKSGYQLGANLSAKMDQALVPSAASKISVVGQYGRDTLLTTGSESQYEEKRYAITAISGDRWRVQDILSEALAGTYSPEDDFARWREARLVAQ